MVGRNSPKSHTAPVLTFRYLSSGKVIRFVVLISYILVLLLLLNPRRSVFVCVLCIVMDGNPLNHFFNSMLVQLFCAVILSGVFNLQHAHRYFKSVSVVKICILFGRAYAEAASSVKLEEKLREEEAAKDNAPESDSMVESGSSDEDGEEAEGSDGKKKKQRVGFRDRKVIKGVTSK